jgi:DNA repair protein RadD
MPEAKSCPECTAIVQTGVMVCPECGYNWPSREREARSDKHTRASVAGDLIDKGESNEYTVIDTQYFLHQKRDNPNAPPTMRVEYKVGNYEWVKEWVCIEHTGFARKKAEDWWAQRSNEPCPDTVDEAVSIGRDGGLTNPTTLLVERKPGEKYTSITRCVLGPRAPVAKDKGTGAWVQEWSADGSDYTPDEVPF